MYFFPFSCQLHIMSPILAVLFFFVHKWLPKRIGLKCILCSFFLRSLIFSRLQSPQGHRTVDRTSLVPNGGLPCPRVFSTKFLSPNSTFLDSTLDLNVPWIWTLLGFERYITRTGFSCFLSTDEEAAASKRMEFTTPFRATMNIY